jgi:ankyrin repeat protein
MSDALTDLLSAAKGGDVDGVRAAVAAGADINGRAPRSYETPGNGYIIPHGGVPALYLAAENRHAQVLDELLKAGADADTMSEGTPFITGEAPLHLAARRGDLDLARALLAGGATPHMKQQSRDAVPGKFALQLAAKAGHLDMVKLLLQHGLAGKQWKNAASAALVDAAEHGRSAMTSVLIEHGADVNKPLHTWTPLMMACFGGFAPVARILLDAGADIHAINKKGMTAMYTVVHGAHMAPENNRDVDSPRDHKEVVELLLERGAKADEGHFHDKNPIDWARGYDWVPLVRRLLPVLESSLQ